MFDWFDSLQLIEKIFAFCAAVGGVLFMIRVVLMFIGAGEAEADADLDLDVDVDADVDIGAQVDADIDAAGEIGTADFSFKILSFQGLTAFFTMFGLVGLAMKRNSGLKSFWAVLGGIAAGLFSVWVISWVFALFKKMQHSGTLDLKNAIGKEGRIYLRIPENGTGKVQVEVQGRLNIFNAVSEDKSEVASDARVKVVDIVSGNVMVVRNL